MCFILFGIIYFYKSANCFHTSFILFPFLSPRIQQIQLINRDIKGPEHDKVWNQLEAEIHLHRHKTVIRACRGRNAKNKKLPSPPEHDFQTLKKQQGVGEVRFIIIFFFNVFSLISSLSKCFLVFLRKGIYNSCFSQVFHLIKKKRQENILEICFTGKNIFYFYK